MHRDIVATRNLNKKNKARLKATGDTEFGVIRGRLSHINKEEKGRLTAADAYDISFRERVEEDIARKGAGTINPFDGMPEYHTEQSDIHWHDDNNPNSDYSLRYPASGTRGNVNEDRGISGEQSYEALTDPDFDLGAYTQSEFGVDDEYITAFDDEPFDFLKQDFDLTTGRAGAQRGFTERQLQTSYDATMGALGSREQSLGLEREGLGIQKEGLQDQLAGLSRGAGRQIGQATEATSARTVGSGFARSGSIAGGFEKQKSQMLQDYKAGSRGVQRGMEGVRLGMEGVQIGLGDVGRERTTALDTLTLGQDVAASDHYYTMAGAGLDFSRGTYTEQKSQLDKFYNQIGSRAAITSSDRRLKENIDYIGDSPSGIKVYEFNYLNNNTRYRGVMADDLVDSHPKVLSKDKDGYYMVDYSKIDVNFETVKGS